MHCSGTIPSRSTHYGANGSCCPSAAFICIGCLSTAFPPPKITPPANDVRRVPSLAGMIPLIFHEVLEQTNAIVAAQLRCHHLLRSRRDTTATAFARCV